jgi:hypothetical protein
MSIPQASACGIPPVLQRFRDIVGAGTISGPRMVASPWSKLPQDRWQLTRLAEVERIIAMLYPHADVVKREQMMRCVEHVRSTRSNRRSRLAESASVLPSPSR